MDFGWRSEHRLHSCTCFSRVRTLRSRAVCCAQSGNYMDSMQGTGEYEQMLGLLSNSGADAALDLLKEAEGKHVSTRPPSLQFSRFCLIEPLHHCVASGPDAKAAHKYPQRVDYLFFKLGTRGCFLVPFSLTLAQDQFYRSSRRPRLRNLNLPRLPTHARSPNARHTTQSQGWRWSKIKSLSEHYGVATTLLVPMQDKPLDRRFIGTLFFCGQSQSRLQCNQPSPGIF